MGLSEFKAAKQKLDEQEDRSVHGARTLTPKQAMLDARDVEARHPDKRIRWLNMADKDKIQSRQLDGYVRLGSEEGGRQLGDMALFAIPRDLYVERVKRKEKVDRERLEAHNREMEQVAEAVVEYLNSRGYNVSRDRILVQEG